MADKAYITPSVLKWARETARFTEEKAASKVSVTKEKYSEWENGTSQPTIVQAQKLAKAFRRPFALFFLPEAPLDFQPLQDFRTPGSKPFSTASVFIIREIQLKQSWVADAYHDNNEEVIPFVGRFSLNDNPSRVARDILETLQIDPTRYTTDNPLLEWVKAAEANGVFVSRSSSINSHLLLDKSELQGFAIADPIAPFIFINSKDYAAPQLFTLVHELAHIWIAESGISNFDETASRQIDKYHPVELFCNEVAANALIPEGLIRGISSSTFNSSKELFRVAKPLGVSTFSFLYRAFKLNLISLTKYRELKGQADADYKEFELREAEKKSTLKTKKNDGGPSPYLLQLNKNSRLFTQTVLDAFRGGHIEPTVASNLLNVQVNRFHKLESCFINS